MRAGRVYQRRAGARLRQRQRQEGRGQIALVCRCPARVWPGWPDSARPLSRKSLEMARCRGRWSDFWQTPGPPPACDTPMAWNHPALIGPLPRCLRRRPSVSALPLVSASHTGDRGPCRGRSSPSGPCPSTPTIPRPPSPQAPQPSSNPLSLPPTRPHYCISDHQNELLLCTTCVVCQWRPVRCPCFIMRHGIPNGQNQPILE